MTNTEIPIDPAPKQPVSEARRAASRTNGAKSRGPVTPEGKQRSSQNSTKHGILARSLTLSDDDAALFESVHNNYIQRFVPRDQPEHDLIEEAVYCKWESRQCWMMHARTLKMHIVADYPEVNTEWSPIALLDRQALAFAKSLKESNILPNLERYARQLSNQSERAIKLFKQLRAERLPPTEPIVEPNEPSPISQHYSTEPCQPQENTEPNEPGLVSNAADSLTTGAPQPNEPKPSPNAADSLTTGAPQPNEPKPSPNAAAPLTTGDRQPNEPKPASTAAAPLTNRQPNEPNPASQGAPATPPRAAGPPPPPPRQNARNEPREASGPRPA